MTEKICDVCVNEFTNCIRRKVSCPYCGFLCCEKCLKTYLISDQRVGGDGRWVPKCMQCTHDFDIEFLEASTTRTFRRGGLQKKQTEVMMTAERMFLTDPYVLRQAAKVKRKKKVGARVDKVDTVIIKVDRDLRKLRKKLYSLHNYKGYLLAGLHPKDFDKDVHWYDQELSYDRNGDERKLGFLFHCGSKECKGILNDSYICQLCDLESCVKCLEIKEKNHECLETSLLTAKEIRKTCRPCPTKECPALIQKKYGCDQMWCPMCKKFFNWRTMESITSGPVHNPEYLQHIEHNPDDVVRFHPEEQVRQNHLPHTVFRHIFKLEEREARHCWSGIAREVSDLQDRMRIIGAVPTGEENRDLAIRYLAETITEKVWTSTVQRRYTIKERDRRESKFIKEFTDIGAGILVNLFYRRVPQDRLSSEISTLGKKTIEEARVECNKGLETIGLSSGRDCLVIPPLGEINQTGGYWRPKRSKCSKKKVVVA